MARLEASHDRLAEHLAVHESKPWHVSFEPMNAELLKRVDRIESMLLSIGRWMLGSMFTIIGVLTGIAVIAFRILETKP